METPSETDSQITKAQALRALHHAPQLLSLVNVWDAAAARAIAELTDTQAIATAGHSIAASLGYLDGAVPRDEMLNVVSRIASAVDLPVTADLDDGYGDAGETVRRAVSCGVVGANIEDRLRPLDESASAIRCAVTGGEAEGVPVVVNARTDAFVIDRNRPLDEKVADAITRGRAYRDAGADCVFVPGNFDASVVERLVEGIGVRRVSVIGLPLIPPPAELQELGVARVSYGQFTQRVALGALQDLARSLADGGTLPSGIRNLN
ncbi:isocitrate lyase/phosphoenolpyruvate mutase family protein [Microbacterium sp. MPKO10]|uniref:isocitrate lyase/PEP mutase family protein n=1 Tax=Microbacterium sp. MPKO10 TaxID=2989818 RepID=UPI003557CEDF